MFRNEDTSILHELQAGKPWELIVNEIKAGRPVPSALLAILNESAAGKPLDLILEEIRTGRPASHTFSARVSQAPKKAEVEAKNDQSEPKGKEEMPAADKNSLKRKRDEKSNEEIIESKRERIGPK